jgi:ankyrin repeat protein
MKRCLLTDSCSGYLDDVDWLAWLIDNGADPNSYETRGGGTTTMLVCALDEAARSGTTSNVTYLLEHGALLDFSNALFHAVRRTTNPEEALQMIKFLIEQGVNVNKIFHDHLPKWTHHLREYRDLGTVYHEAIARNQSEELIQVLLDAGANPNALSKNGLTAQEWKEKRYCSNRKHEV